MFSALKQRRESRDDQFSEDEIRGIFQRITPSDLKALRLLEENEIGLGDIAIAAGARLSITEASESLRNLGNLGLVSVGEDERFSIDPEALHEVVMRAPELLFRPEQAP